MFACTALFCVNPLRLARSISYSPTNLVSSLYQLHNDVATGPSVEFTRCAGTVGVQPRVQDSKTHCDDL